MDKMLFSLPPSFYALLSGALIGAGINLLTGLLFAQNLMIDKTFMTLAIFFLLVSSVLFAWISLVLEELRVEAKGGVHLLRMIRDRKVLYPLAIGGSTSFIISIVFLYFAMV
jgi:hypothetical protein